MKSVCQNCEKEISFRMEQASQNRFHKSLCIECQIVEIRKTYPPKLAEMSIKNLEQYR